MPVTATPRKQNEAPDIDQSTSDMKVKTSKTEDQKGQANMPQNDATSSLEDQIRFNDDVLKKLSLIEQNASPDVRKDLQEALEMIENRNNHLKKEKESKTTNRLRSLIFDMQKRIFEDLSDKDLVNLMLSDRAYDDVAGCVLQRRKISLCSLRILYGTDVDNVVLEVMTGRDRKPRYTLNVENAAAICEGYEKQKGNNLTRAVYLLFSYYNCSAADYCSDGIPLTLEAFFGPATSELSEKIKIGCLQLTSYTAPLLGWLSPKNLDVYDSPNSLIQASQKELKELIAGIDTIIFKHSHIGCVDKMMEACEANYVYIGNPGSYWSDESILSVVQANVNNNGITRTIKMWNKGRFQDQWLELFAFFTNSYEDCGFKYCTIALPNCDFEYSGGFVTFVFGKSEESEASLDNGWW